MSTIAAVQELATARASIRLRHVVIGFAATLLAAVVLAVAAATAIGLVNQGRVLPGVVVDNVSLGGLDRDAALERLRTALPPLSAGTATVRIGSAEVQVSYERIGRAFDLEGMADAAYGTGRTENPVALVIARLHDALVGTSLAPRVKAFDPPAMDSLATAVANTYSRAPVDAAVIRSSDGALTVQVAVTGRTVEASAVRQAIGDATASTNPEDMTIVVPYTSVAPAVNTAEAVAAGDLARAMTETALPMTDGTEAFSLAPAVLTSVLTFGIDESGIYAPRIDPTGLANAVAGLAKHVDRKATDATYKWGATITVIPSKTGRALDQAATRVLVANALAARAAGAASTGPLQLAVTVTQPKLGTAAAQASVARIVRIGTWTTYYHPGISNGYGANISVPAQAINGMVVAPGATFDFWRDIGPVTAARGYRYGGAIIHGKSEPTGAFAGGICSTSTTLFNAALRAGLQMGARANHYYYIARYPVGLDATVFQDQGWVTTMTWTNDTPYPVIIRSVTSYGIVRFDLYSVPTGRTVTLTKPIITNRVPALLYDGFDAQVTRYVRDAKGNVIHVDTYFSHYHAVNA